MGGLRFAVVAEKPSFFELALGAFEHRGTDAREPIEERSRWRHFDALGWLWAEVILEDEDPRVRREEIERALCESRGRVEAVHQRLAELVDVEDVRDRASQGEDVAFELEAFVKEHLRDPLLNLRAHGVDENENDERAHHGMQEQRLAGDESHQPEHEGQHERERGEHAEPSGELVEIDEAVVRDRLRQRVEEDEDQNRADGRDVDAGVGQILDDREEAAERARQGDVAEPGAFDSGIGLEAALVERAEGQGQEDGHVGEEPADDQGVVVVRREHHPEQDDGSPDRGPLKEAGALGRRGDENAEETNGGEREKNAANQVEPLPERHPPDDAQHERADVPEARIGREDSEQPPVALAVGAKHDAGGEREAE